MINELDMVCSWLDGDNINPKYLYRICRMLTKFYYESLGNDRAKIRENIFAWANKNKIFIDFDLNDCIDGTIDYNYVPLKNKNNPIYVSEYDISSIINRFDNKNIRLIAFGILLYAKQYSANGEFTLPITAFGDWIGISASNIISRYLKDLLNYNYLEKIEVPHQKWENLSSKKIRHPRSKFRMLVNIENVGFYKIDDNNIRKAFNELFRYDDNNEYAKRQEQQRTTEKHIAEWFINNYKKILGEEYMVFRVSSKESVVPDFMAVKDGILYPVKLKVGEFNHRAFNQLSEFMKYYKCKNGIAVGKKLKNSIPQNIKFVPHPY